MPVASIIDRVGTLLAVSFALGLSQLAPTSCVSACNIPVFRFALERWQPDPYELVLITNGQSEGPPNARIAQLRKYVDGQPSLCRLTIYERNQLDASEDAIQNLVQPFEPETRYPQLIVRTKLGRDRVATTWQGELDSFDAKSFFGSSARSEIADRLLQGHAVVWLVLASDNPSATEELTRRLEEQLDELDNQIPLPEGIGLPGSELYSSIPLNMKFSVLTLKRDDPDELPFIQFLKQFQPDAFAAGQPLVVPIFGKGRGLEVIPADRLSDGLVEDLSIFLSGACSCQVKDLNPGFDLPMAIQWNREIFGDEVMDLPPETGPGQKRDQPAELVPIAPGNRGGRSGTDR